MSEVLCKLYNDCEFDIVEWNGKSRMIGDRRISSMWVASNTEKNRELVIEHNSNIRKIKELMDRNREICSQLEGKIS